MDTHSPHSVTRSQCCDRIGGVITLLHGSRLTGLVSQERTEEPFARSAHENRLTQLDDRRQFAQQGPVVIGLLSETDPRVEHDPSEIDTGGTKGIQALLKLGDDLRHHIVIHREARHHVTRPTPVHRNIGNLDARQPGEHP